MKRPKSRSQKFLLFGVGFLVVGLAIIFAFVFGERSPVIAEGVIKLPPHLVSQAQGMRTLYIIVKDANQPASMPMPWGAFITTLPSEPTGDVYHFLLTKDNMRVMGGGETPLKINIKARLDLDGLGGADQPGDITGHIEHVNSGAKGLEINLTDLVQEQDSTAASTRESATGGSAQ
jgi:hypothetical protein